MSRLLLFGCSFTRGQGLPDYDPDYKGDNCSKYVWGGLLGKKWGMETINNAQEGSSIKYSIWKIFNQQYQEGDTVICLLPFNDRYCVLRGIEDDVYNWHHMSAHNIENGEEKYYYKYIHEDWDHWVMNSMMIKGAQAYLDNIGVKHYWLTTGDVERDTYRKYGVENILNTYMGSFHGIDPTECKHMGIESNRLFAEFIDSEINGGEVEVFKDHWRDWFVHFVRQNELKYLYGDETRELPRSYSFVKAHRFDVPFDDELDRYIASRIGHSNYVNNGYILIKYGVGDYIGEHTDYVNSNVVTYTRELQASDCGSKLLVDGIPMVEAIFTSNVKHEVKPITAGERISLTMFGTKPTSLL